jgi:hypothetical protein
MPPARRRVQLGKLQRALGERIAYLEKALLSADETQRPRIELDIALQRSRLAWLAAQGDGSVVGIG